MAYYEVWMQSKQGPYLINKLPTKRKIRIYDGISIKELRMIGQPIIETNQRTAENLAQEKILVEDGPIFLTPAIYQNAELATIQVQTGGIIFTIDATTPTFTNGTIVEAVRVIWLESNDAIINFQAIAMPTFQRLTTIVATYDHSL